MMSLAVCLNRRMSVQDNWLANLRALVDREAPGEKKRPGIRLVAESAGVNEEYIYQLYHGKTKADGSLRVVGVETAKAISRAFADGRPLDWIDKPPEVKKSPGPRSPGAPPSKPNQNFEDSRTPSDSDWAILEAVKTMIPMERLTDIVNRHRELKEQAKQEIMQAAKEAAAKKDKGGS